MGTKKFRFLIVFLVTALLSTMIFAHQRVVTQLKNASSQLENLNLVEQRAANLSFIIERYRRQASNYRKLEPAQINQAKAELKSTFEKGISALAQLDSDPSNQAHREKVMSELTDLLAQSTEIERTSYSKDPFQKEEIRNLHTSIENELNAILASAQSKAALLSKAGNDADSRALQIFYGCSVAVLCLLLGLLIENYFVFFRPLRKLHDYAASIRAGKSGVNTENSPSLPGVYGDIQVSLSKLAENVEGHLKERHKFIRDVVADLRSPLNMLQAGRKFLKNGNQPDEAQAQAAAHSMKHGLAILSGSLDDLTDIVEINRLETRLEETIIDLTELISDVARTFNGVNHGQPVTFSVPPMPVWVKMDRKRFERVLVQVVSKVGSTFSGGIHILLAEASAKEGRGLQVVVCDATRVRKGQGSTIASGPELDILKHWISDNGLGMALAYKVIRAHGGAINASGVNGTAVQIMIRLPAERLAGNGLIMPPEGLRLGAENSETPKITPQNFI
jgi:archaellum component FlaC